MLTLVRVAHPSTSWLASYGTARLAHGRVRNTPIHDDAENEHRDGEVLRAGQTKQHDARFAIELHDGAHETVTRDECPKHLTFAAAHAAMQPPEQRQHQHEHTNRFK